jgi:hypothetical protein
MILRTRLNQLQDALHEPAALQREPEPDCSFRGSLSNPATDEQMRTKIEYELKCYRQAESMMRARVRQLQGSTTGRK